MKIQSIALMSFTTRLVPSLSAPSSRNLSASSNEEMPPAAFIFTPSPICSENSFISSKVAPAVPKPVDVLM